MAFVPSEYSDGYGADESAVDQLLSAAKAAQPALSIAQELIGKSDAEKLAILRARVKNYKKMRNTVPYSVVPGTLWYNNEIRKMNAQIKALGGIVAQDKSATDDYSTLRKLTIAGGVVGVLIGGAVIYRLVK